MSIINESIKHVEINKWQMRDDNYFKHITSFGTGVQSVKNNFHCLL